MKKEILYVGGGLALIGIGYYVWKTQAPKPLKKNYVSSSFFNQPKQRSQDTSF